MITSFKHKGLREFFERINKRGIPPELSTRLRDRLDVIDAATTWRISLYHTLVCMR
jgi:plasmid maintenance system killer protein